MICAAFAGKRSLQRHQMVYGTLGHARRPRDSCAGARNADARRMAGPLGHDGRALRSRRAVKGAHGQASHRGGHAARRRSSRSPARRTPRCRFWPRRCSPTGPVTLGNVPQLNDIATTLKLLKRMGVAAEHRDDGNVAVDAAGIKEFLAPYELVKTMRASILVLGPLLGRFGHADVSLPGGCAIGARPVNLHVMGLRAMGASISIDNGYIRARATKLKGARLVLDTVTVTGTENLMMAAACARRRDRHRERRARARDRRARELPDGDGREDRGRRLRHDSYTRSRDAFGHDATTSCRTVSRAARTSSRPRSPAGE